MIVSLRSEPSGLVGQVFGQWTVVSEANKDRHYNKMFICLCSCGAERKVSRGSLLSGNSKSCGHSKRKTGSSHPTWKGFGEIPSVYWKSITRGAQLRDIEFSITIEDAWLLFLEQNRCCALSGVLLQFGSKHLGTQTTASLDRICSTTGYTYDNIQWIHKRINFMKSNDSDAEFIEWCKRVTEFSGAQ